MKKIKTKAIITPLQHTTTTEPEEGELTLDEKHFRFGFLNVAYSNITHAEIISEGGFLFFKEHYLVLCDEHRRYQFGPFMSKGFLEALPLFKIDQRHM